jgi:hypothetical protein
MNERIRLLAERAETYADYYAMLSETGEKEIFIKKFAELIVKECAGVCEDYRGTEWGKAAECIGDSIKEHFGVEE